MEQTKQTLLSCNGFDVAVAALVYSPADNGRHADLRAWVVSLVGAREALRAVWAGLLKRREASIYLADELRYRRLSLASEEPGVFGQTTAALPGAGGHHLLLLPAQARYASSREDGEFLLLPPPGPAPAEAATALPAHFYRFLNARVPLPLHEGWADWLWDRALDQGWATPLPTVGFGGPAYLCRPDQAALREALGVALRRGEIHVPGHAPVGSPPHAARIAA